MSINKSLIFIQIKAGDKDNLNTIVINVGLNYS